MKQALISAQPYGNDIKKQFYSRPGNFAINANARRRIKYGFFCFFCLYIYIYIFDINKLYYVCIVMCYFFVLFV